MTTPAEEISVMHSGYSVQLPESLYFNAIPYDGPGMNDSRPAGRMVQVESLLLLGGFNGAPPYICVYGGWYLLNGALSKQFWGGGACIHWHDIPVPVQNQIWQQAGTPVGPWSVV